MFLGRERELATLEKLYQQNKFQLFILYGRRRVGKTTLLKEFCRNKPAIFYAVEQTNSKLNLEKFSLLIFHHYAEENMEAFSSWEQALRFLAERSKKQSLVVVLDEFPYLANLEQGLLSKLQHLIDHELKNSNLFLVLCGSFVSFMEQEVLGAKSPLFGRRTAQLRLKVFDYYQSSLFLSHYSVEDKIIMYGIFGGTPLYLQQVDNKLSLGENVKNIFLENTGYLHEETILLLRQELQEPSVYYSILEVIAQGATRANEIAVKTGETAAKCLKYMSILQDLDLLYKEVPLGAKHSGRRSQYGIKDSMFRFWYRYVLPNKTLLEIASADVIWKKKISPDLSQYMGSVFEEVCKTYMLRKNIAEKLPFLFTEIGRWWGTDNVKRQEVEIDLVAGDGKQYIFGECKWHNEKMGLQVLDDLREKAKVFSPKTKASYYYLFSKSGFTNELECVAKVDKHVKLISLEELFVI